MKKGLNRNIYIAEGVLFVFLQGMGVHLGLIEQPVVGGAILAVTIHGTVLFLDWIEKHSEDSFDEITPREIKEKTRIPEVTILEEFKNQPSQRSLRI